MTLEKLRPALAFFAATLAVTVAANAQMPDATGTWETDSGSIDGKGGGHIQMTVAQRGSSLTWSTSTGYTYICTLHKTRCAGTWSGKTGGGWFDVNFAANGSSFSGTWGYRDDHSKSGTFTGHR